MASEEPQGEARNALRTVLVATDLSPRSDRAVDRAVRLVAPGRRLVVLHVIDDELPEPIAQASRTDAHRLLREQLDGHPLGAPADYEIDVALGQPAATIIERIDQHEAGLVVIGTHRHGGLLDWFRGTTAERVLRHAEAPVLMVKERPAAPYRRIVVAVDFSVYSRRAVEFARHLVPDGSFLLVHAFDVPFSSTAARQHMTATARARHEATVRRMVDEQLEAFLRTFEPPLPPVRTVMREGAARPVIEAEVEGWQADLLVVGTHGRTGVARALLGSVAAELLRDPPCDVLAVRAW
jgi:nucleotide-binding universal stress UspA family protein